MKPEYSDLQSQLPIELQHFVEILKIHPLKLKTFLTKLESLKAFRIIQEYRKTLQIPYVQMIQQKQVQRSQQKIQKEMSSDGEVMIIENPEMEKRRNKQEREEMIKRYYQQELKKTVEMINEKLAMLDINEWCRRLKNSDQIIENQIVIKQEGLPIQVISSMDQISILLMFFIEKAQSLIHKNEKIKEQFISVQLKFKGQNINGQTYSFTTYSMDLITLIQTYIDIKYSTDQQTKQDNLKQLMKLFGLDLSHSNLTLNNSMIDLKLSQIKMTLFSLLPLSTLSPTQEKLQMIEYPDYLNADTTLYAISRARLQYLGQNIPLFRYSHQLFEALMSAVHPEEVSPLSDSNLDISDEERGKQEQFLIRKLLEFSLTPNLDQLLQLSLQKETIKFIEAFNSLSPEFNKFYSRFKISLYDINQRKFIIQGLGQSGCQEVYMIHYNGYVFGTNYPKLMVIRERETLMNNNRYLDFDDDIIDIDQYRKNLDNSSSDDEDSEQLNEAKAKEYQITEHSVYDLPSDLQDVMKSMNSIQKDDDELSEVEVKTAFILSQSILKNNTRRSKLTQLIEKSSNGKSIFGLLAFKIEYKLEENVKIPNKLVCYGSFHLGSPNDQKRQFDGPKCHIKFLLWLLQSALDYFSDSRKKSKFINVFSMNGSSKEMSLILRGLCQIVGRDVHFIGDINKLKIIWIENIRFYDLSNYFEGFSLKQLAFEWNLQQKQSLISLNYPDTLTQQVILTYELV